MLLLFLAVVVVGGLFFTGQALTVVNSGPLRSVYLEVPEKELFKGGTLISDFTVVSAAQDDYAYIFYYEIYDGDAFLRSGYELIRMQNDEFPLTLRDEFISSEMESGKHTLTYKFWWTGSAHRYSLSKVKESFAEAFVDGRCPICSSRYYSQAVCEGPACWKDFDPTIQHSKYFDSTTIKPLFTTSPKSDIFCIDYCGKTDIQFIEKYSVKECSTDDECSQFDALCVEGYCFKEVIKEIQTEKITPVYVGSTCEDVDCGLGFVCNDDDAGAYCVSEDTGWGVIEFMIGIVLGLFVVFVLVLVGVGIKARR